MMVGYDTSPWWPITVPLGVLVVVYFLKLVSDQPKKDNHYIFLGLLSGLFLNMHFQFIFIMFFITLFLLINRRTSIKQALIGIFSFLITLTPLLIFDLRHQFLNTNLFLGFFSKGIDNAPFQPTAWLPVFTNFIEPFIPLKNIYLTGLFYIVILAASVFLFQKSIGFKKNFYLSFIILYLLFPFVFTKYGRRPSEYYFIFLYPFIYIAIADFFILLKKEFFLALIIFYLVLADLRPIKDQLRSNPYGLYYKDRLIQKLAGQIRGQRFNITFSVPPGANHGYRYLFDYYQIKQTGDWHDPIVQIRIPPNKESTYVSEAKALSFIIPKELR